MKVKSMTLLLVAGGCGLVAMLGVQQAMQPKDAGAAEEMGQVLVATAEIQAGTLLDETNTVFKQVPLSALPEGAVTQQEQYQDRAVKTFTVVGETIMLAKLGEEGTVGPSVTIPPGMRVITVQCDTTMTHSNMLRPGDRVDILLTFKSQSRKGNLTQTRTVLEYIKVFATDSVRDSRNVENQEIQAKNISLLVDPQQAGILKLAESRGKLHLSLRSQSDKEAIAADTVTEEELMGYNGAGIDDKEAEKRLIGGEGEKGEGDVRQFVKGETATQQVAEVAEQATPKWQMHIFAGSEHRVEEVELPTTDNPWGQWLHNMIDGTGT